MQNAPLAVAGEQNNVPMLEDERHDLLAPNVSETSHSAQNTVPEGDISPTGNNNLVSQRRQPTHSAIASTSFESNVTSVRSESLDGAGALDNYQNLSPGSAINSPQQRCVTYRPRITVATLQNQLTNLPKVTCNDSTPVKRRSGVSKYFFKSVNYYL